MQAVRVAVAGVVEPVAGAVFAVARAGEEAVDDAFVGSWAASAMKAAVSAGVAAGR